MRQRSSSVTVVVRKKKTLAQSSNEPATTTGQSRREGKLTAATLVLSPKGKADVPEVRELTPGKSVSRERPREKVDTLSPDEACAFIFSHKVRWDNVRMRVRTELERKGLLPIFVGRALKPADPSKGWRRLDNFLEGPGKLWPNEVVILSRCFGIRASELVDSRYWEPKRSPRKG